MSVRHPLKARTFFFSGEGRAKAGRRGRAGRSLTALLAFSLAVLLAASPPRHGAQTGEGELDPTFGGGDGRVHDNFGELYFNQANAVVVQQDGKIVIVAEAHFRELGFDFGLARYNPDGSLDPTFGAGGKVVTNIHLANDVPHALLLQPDGKLVAAGQTTSDAAGIVTSEFALVRYNPDGSLDQTFGGGDGIVVTDFNGGGDVAYGVALQADGKIVAAGTSGQGETGANFAAARYNPDGSLDDTFGDPGTGVRSGRVVTDFVAWDDIGRGLALQADGKIVVAGHTQTPSTHKYDFALVRYLADGRLDATFDGDGRVTTRFFEEDYVDDERAYAVRVQPDGKIVAAGFARDANETQPATRSDDFALARYNPDGSLDQTFGAGGRVWTNIFIQEGGVNNAGLASKDRAHALLLQPDGKLVAGGFAGCCSNDGTEDFALARYHTDGSLDTSFGGDGIAHTDFLGRFDTDDEIYGMALQTDGRIVAVGGTETDPYRGTHDYAIARYTGPVPQTTILQAQLDAHVKGSTPDLNYGASAELQVKRTYTPGNGKGRQAYLRFDTSAVPGTVTKATLRVHARLSAVTQANSNIPLAAFPVSAAWDEGLLTWANKPSPNAPVELGRVIVADATPRWYEFDITNFIKQERAAGRNVTGVLLRNMLRGEVGDYYTAISSREAAGNQPQLVIEHR